MDGWIKLHRCSLENPVVCKDSDYFAVWCYLLLMATHKDIDMLFGGERITLNAGQLITGRNSISSKLHINESKVKRILICFENDQQIDRKRCSQNSLITILNWEKYQSSDQQNDQPVTNECPTNDQRVTTNKNKRTKEHKNIRNKDIKNNKASSDAIVSSYTENQDLKNTILDFLEMRKSIKAKMTDRALELMLNKLDKLGKDDEQKILILEQSIEKSWRGIFELKNRGENIGEHRTDNETGSSGVEETEGERLNRIALERMRDQHGELRDTECEF